ncbi:hypothetical protein BOTBODRAFT_66231 [Botryobasidium botryosum FD-172 SS1]|uniref:Uncharacterized protein n=1 Tax=Botryobasidium botryosum (strain FD-172 SS1) TaxID=930990 RepID=A0A067MR98_BOTB1|nr:hypothetical protein BOTBODRAFT_66231 [Botryobasidium botryosum FD-172 SS1]
MHFARLLAFGLYAGYAAAASKEAVVRDTQPSGSCSQKGGPCGTSIGTCSGNLECCDHLQCEPRADGEQSGWDGVCVRFITP